MKAIAALYKANVKDFLRNRASVLIVGLLPLTFALFFGMVFGGGQYDLHDAQGQPIRQIDLYLPSMLGIAFLWLGLFATATPLVEQREAQVLRRLRATPATVRQVLVAQVAHRVTIGLAQAALFVAVSFCVFGVGVKGSPLLFLGSVLLGAALFVSMGYALAGLARSTEGVAAMGQMVNFPMMFLTGTFVPMEMMPSYLRPIGSVLPLAPLNDALRQLMASAPPLNPLWLDFAMLGGWLVLMLALAVKFWRWE